MNLQSITPGTESELVEKLGRAVESAKANGIAVSENLFSLSALRHMYREGDKLNRIYRRNVRPWHKTQRATLFPTTIEKPGGPLQILLSSAMRAPTTDRAAWMVAAAIRKIGVNEGLSPLANWHPNRIGFNYMDGSENDPAKIPRHQDPVRETGLVVAVELPNPEISTEDQDSYGSATLILSANTCRELGIDRPFHEVETTTRRISLTIAELHRHGWQK